MTSLAVQGENIIAGDAISSVSVLKVSGTDLQTVARHYGPLWPVTVESVRNSGVIGANVSQLPISKFQSLTPPQCDCNLFTFSIAQLNGRRILQLDGNFHLGDVVNKFIPGNIHSVLPS